MSTSRVGSAELARPKSREWGNFYIDIKRIWTIPTSGHFKIFTTWCDTESVGDRVQNQIMSTRSDEGYTLFVWRSCKPNPIFHCDVGSQNVFEIVKWHNFVSVFVPNNGFGELVSLPWVNWVWSSLLESTKKLVWRQVKSFEFVSWPVSLITMDDFMHTQGPPLKKYLDFEVLISGQESTFLKD